MNTTAYDQRDLERLFAKGLWALGCRKHKLIKVLRTSGDSHGEAVVGRCSAKGRGGCEASLIILRLPPPHRMTFRRLTRLFEHEVLHSIGKDHDQMTRKEYWSLGPVPSWAKGSWVHYHGHGQGNEKGGVLR